MVGKHYIYEFQFLLGRLKTPPGIFGRPRAGEFQFLLGRLKTRQAQAETDVEPEVSIPLRQAKNDI